MYVSHIFRRVDLKYTCLDFQEQLLPIHSMCFLQLFIIYAILAVRDVVYLHQAIGELQTIYFSS